MSWPADPIQHTRELLQQTHERIRVTRAARRDLLDSIDATQNAIIVSQAVIIRTDKAILTFGSLRHPQDC
ncbi:hypothetical protein [Occallatibacter savannae]|uniref:hypothetical protein n=1 Tax=Occallatibacter savannae TaxID=1002691 RepID=UPI000D69EF46|nr:hypothetical protein [Occallatibacter savannae]